jgi:hypothetical protein
MVMMEKEKKNSPCFCGRSNSDCLTHITVVQEIKKLTLLNFVKIEMSGVFEYRTAYETETHDVPFVFFTTYLVSSRAHCSRQRSWK